MNISRALKAARAAAERRMTSTLTVERKTGETTDANGKVTDVWMTVYSGRGYLQSFEAYESTPVAVEHTYTVQRYKVHLPIGAGPFEVGDRATVDAEPNDPQLVGRKFRITTPFNKSHATAQRLPVEEVTG